MSTELNRTTSYYEQCCGYPFQRSLRKQVMAASNLFADGALPDEVLADYPLLLMLDITATPSGSSGNSRRLVRLLVDAWRSPGFSSSLHEASGPYRLGLAPAEKANSAGALWSRYM